MRRTKQKMAYGMPGILRWGIPGLLVWACWVGVTLGQNISTVAGNGNFGSSGDGGPATDASLADPAGIFVDSSGNLYIADTNNRRVRRVDTGGVTTTVAGNGNFGSSGDGGPATDASLPILRVFL